MTQFHLFTVNELKIKSIKLTYKFRFNFIVFATQQFQDNLYFPRFWVTWTKTVV